MIHAFVSCLSAVIETDAGSAALVDSNNTEQTFKCNGLEPVICWKFNLKLTNKYN